MTYRNNSPCAHCKRQTAVFVCRASATEAWYRCVATGRKGRCGKMFRAEHPKPLARIPEWLNNMIAGKAA